MSSLELKIPPVALVLLLGALMWGTARLASGPRQVPPGGDTLAAALAVGGIAVAIAGVASFRRARTTVNPMNPGASTHLVVAGIYRLTRNPMYLGMLLLLLGWAVHLASVPALVFAFGFVPLMNCLQIRAEERALAAKFGPEFVAYAAKVRRWL